MFISFYEAAYVNDLTYKNSANQIGQIIRFLFIKKLEFSGFKIQNYTGDANPIAPIIGFLDRASTTTSFKDVQITNSNFKKTILILGSLLTDSVTISNFDISNSTMSSGNSLILYPVVGHVEVSNFTIRGFETSDFENSETLLIDIRTLNLGNDYQTEVFEVKFLRFIYRMSI
jgi:hypothetical protein